MVQTGGAGRVREATDAWAEVPSQAGRPIDPGLTESAEATVERVAAAERAKSLLRILTCGSVDDGKSTLLGRILYDADCVYDDQLATLHNESRGRVAPGELDFSLLLDGLSAEREQGITIDVAWRYFATAKRKVIVADCPGHVQYTRNMATGASQCDAAILLIDARKGILTQTRRHCQILALLGIRHVVVAVNKMDLVGWDRSVFARIAAEFTTYAASLGIDAALAIPVSALKGEGVLARASSMPWYQGPTLMEWLEAVQVEDSLASGPFRMPVQWVNRQGVDFRGFSGTIERGKVLPGDALRVARRGTEATVARIVTMDGDLAEAEAGLSVTLVLDREIDVSRGDLLAAASDPPVVADQFVARLLWFGEAPMAPGRTYLLRIGTDEVPASITQLKHRIDIETGASLAARRLELNELAVVNLSTDRPIAFDAYDDCHRLGGFVLIDRQSCATIAAGRIDFALRRSTNLTPQDFDTTPAARAVSMGQRPAILWFTGLSGAGKSTIANLVDRELMLTRHHAVVLDGDNIRHGLSRDLGFTEADRVENIRRVAEVAKLMAEAGLIVLVCLISPFRTERDLARRIAGSIPFLEIHVDAPLRIAEGRDPKGLYAKARAGKIANFTGISSPYEPPLEPDLHLATDRAGPEELAQRVLALLHSHAE